MKRANWTFVVGYDLNESNIWGLLEQHFVEPPQVVFLFPERFSHPWRVKSYTAKSLLQTGQERPITVVTHSADILAAFGAYIVECLISPESVLVLRAEERVKEDKNGVNRTWWELCSHPFGPDGFLCNDWPLDYLRAE